ncbi:MAG TPA: glycerol-3-phosphate 1-O-acyltransferase PlsY [Candidatus Limnocylindrales bacterium]|nr:glycerol-3-phosphate 1-O-acyltransferase PlsY [Candidatus Limnocylindrales bacterium]
MPTLGYILTALAAYLVGSIPFGFLVAKAKGIDIRAVGSGNIGATNAMRALGKPAGIFVLLMDVLKGYAACAFLAPHIFDWLIPHYSGFFRYFHDMPVELQTRFYVVAGIFAVLGHNYTCWLKFKGGKGIATTTGVYLALAWPAVLIGLVVFILGVLLTRYASVGSIAAAIALPVTVWVMTPHNLFLGIVTTALGVMAIYKHKSNIQRLMAGTESRLGKKTSTTETTK